MGAGLGRRLRQAQRDAVVALGLAQRAEAEHQVGVGGVRPGLVAVAERVAVGRGGLAGAALLGVELGEHARGGGRSRIEHERAPEVPLGLVGPVERDQRQREAHVQPDGGRVDDEGAAVEDLGLPALAGLVVDVGERPVGGRHRLVVGQLRGCERVGHAAPTSARAPSKRNPSTTARSCGSAPAKPSSVAVPTSA